MSWLPQWLGPRNAASDEQLMRQLQPTGDHAAFMELMSRWELRVRRLCYRMIGDEHRAEDLAQEAFSRVFTHRHQFDVRRKFSTWLWRIAINLCYEESRRSGRRGESSFEEGDDHALPRSSEAGPHEHAAESERAELLRAAIRALPDTHRAIVMLREFEGLKFREIADVLEVPEGTVKWRMTEAMKQLSAELRPKLAEDETRDGTKTARSKERLLL